MAKNKPSQQNATPQANTGATVEEKKLNVQEPETPTDETGPTEEELRIKEEARLAAEEEQKRLEAEAQAEKDRLAAEEAARLAQEKAQREAEQLAAEQKAKEDAAAAESRKAADALFSPQDSSLVSQLKANLDNYLLSMHLSKPQSVATLNTNQRLLHRTLVTWLNAEDISDFLGFGEYFVAQYRLHRNGVLNPANANRGFDNVELTFVQRSLMSAINNIFYILTNPNRTVAKASTGDVKNQVHKFLPEQSTQRLVAYVNSLLS